MYCFTRTELVLSVALCKLDEHGAVIASSVRLAQQADAAPIAHWNAPTDVDMMGFFEWEGYRVGFGEQEPLQVMDKTSGTVPIFAAVFDSDYYHGSDPSCTAIYVMVFIGILCLVTCGGDVQDYEAIVFTLRKKGWLEGWKARKLSFIDYICSNSPLVCLFQASRPILVLSLIVASCNDA